MKHHTIISYVSEASRRHYFHSRGTEPLIDAETLRRVSVYADEKDKIPDTMIRRFYRKFGEDWQEKVIGRMGNED